MLPKAIICSYTDLNHLLGYMIRLFNTMVLIFLSRQVVHNTHKGVGFQILKCYDDETCQCILELVVVWGTVKW